MGRSVSGDDVSRSKPGGNFVVRILVVVTPHDPRDSPNEAEIVLDLGEKFRVELIFIFVTHVVSVDVDNVKAVSPGPGYNHSKVSVGVFLRGFGDEDMFPDQNGQASASG